MLGSSCGSHSSHVYDPPLPYQDPLATSMLDRNQHHECERTPGLFDSLPTSKEAWQNRVFMNIQGYEAMPALMGSMENAVSAPKIPSGKAGQCYGCED